MCDYVWLALGVLLFLVWGLSYIVFHVAGLLIHLLLVFALIFVILDAFIGKHTAPRQWPVSGVSS
jgi:Family of unknown function (DUF5670)